MAVDAGAEATRFASGDPYAILGLAEPVNSAVLQRAYRALSRVHHPDKSPPGAEAKAAALARFQAISWAYEQLLETVRARGQDEL